jgi:ParB-like chromosome segregation protein Spo0J
MVGERGETSGTEPLVELRLDSLVVGPSVRLGGVRADHVRALADLNGRWPPLVVARKGHTIVDGVHRFHAAKLLGLTRLTCVWFDGDATEEFVQALRLNVRHGLPLSLKEREAAAAQLLSRRPQWSDRRIGQLCGLAHATIADLRQYPGRPTGGAGQLYREGRDGRNRPVDAAARRETIARAIREDTDASLRTIAALAGSTPSTVRRVRARMMTSEQEIVRNELNLVQGGLSGVPAVDMTRSVAQPSTLGSRRSVTPDQPMSTSAAVEDFANWLERTAIDETWRGFVDTAPMNRIEELRDEAHRRAEEWRAFALALDNRAGRRAPRRAATPTLRTADVR